MRPRDLAAAISGLTALAVSILAIGGALRWSQALVAGLVGVALICHVRSRSVLGRVSPLVGILGLAAALTAFQLFPLPGTLLDALNPTGNILRADGAALLGTKPWQALTLDAPGTLRALTGFIILLGVAVVALRIALTERGRYRILASVALIAGLTSIVVGVHELCGATRLYGLYEPAHATPSVLGPLLNENHLGGLMAIGAVTAVGLMMYRRQRSWLRASWLVILGMCGATTVASLSRGATLALAAGTVVAIGVMLGQRLATAESGRRRRGTFLTSSLPIGVVAVCTVVVVIYASAGGISRELSRTTLQEITQPKSKYAAWKSAAILVEESPWIGVGRGAFEPSFTRVHPASAFATFSHVENEYVQAAVDWGLPGAIALGVALIWLAVTAIRKWRDGPVAAAGLGALTVAVLQSNVDFGMELLGLAVPTTLIAATLTYVPLREGSPRQLIGARMLRIGHFLALAGCTVLLLSNSTRLAAEDRADLSARKPITMDAVREMATRHPLDYYNYAVAARLMVGVGDPLGVRLLNHALTLHPTHAGLHRMAATLLYRTGRIEQATIEFAAAMRGTVRPRALLEEIAALFPSVQAASAIPIDAHPPTEIVKVLEGLGRAEAATLFLSRVLDARPNDFRVCSLLYDLSLRRGDLDVVRLAERRCPDFEPSQHSVLSLAHVLYRKQAYAETVRLLKDVETWPGRIDVKIKGWLTLCDSHIGLANWDDAKRCIRRLDVSGLITAETRPQVTSRLEHIEGAIKKTLAGEQSESAPAIRTP